MMNTICYEERRVALRIDSKQQLSLLPSTAVMINGSRGSVVSRGEWGRLLMGKPGEHFRCDDPSP